MATTYPTSKNNALASLATFIQDNVLDTNETFFFGNYQQAVQFPALTMIDKGAPDLGPLAFNDFMGNDPTHNQQYGKIGQTVVEFGCLDEYTSTQTGPNPQAVKNVMLMRERLRRALYLAGQFDVNGDQYFPDIKLLDFDTNGNPWTGGYVFFPGEEQNVWFENSYLSESDSPNLKRIEISARIRWTEIF